MTEAQRVETEEGVSPAASRYLKASVYIQWATKEIEDLLLTYAYDPELTNVRSRLIEAAAWLRRMDIPE
jgi:hypothetical protein